MRADEESGAGPPGRFQAAAAKKPLTPEEVRRRARFSMSGLAPFSPVLSQLLASISQTDDSISLPRIAASIEKDVVLSGKVLSAANSALFSRGQTIYLITHAVARLGLNPLRNLVIGFSVTRLWSKARVPAAFSINRFNQHALAVATLADLIAGQIGKGFAEEAFVSGLFHDVGQLLLANIFGDEYTQMLKELNDPRAVEAAERERFCFGHSELSADMVALWKLPPPVQFAVRNHENPAGARGLAGYLHLTNIVNAADCYADVLGFTLQESEVAVSCEEIAERLKIDDALLRRDFERHFVNMR